MTHLKKKTLVSYLLEDELIRISQPGIELLGHMQLLA